MTDEIMSEYDCKAVKYENEILFHEQDAIEIIKKCQELNRKILGIETFVLDPPYIEPMDDFDYTSIYYKNFDPEVYFTKYHICKNADLGHWAEATQFIKERSDRGWLFEIDYEWTFNDIISK
jgi:hypothetical protein